MAGVGKNHDGKGAQARNYPSPVDDANRTPVRPLDVAGAEVIYNEDNEIANRDESNDRSVLERIEAPKVGQGYQH